MSRKRIVFNNGGSSEDSLSPPEKRFKKEVWENRAKRLETEEASDFKIIVKDQTIRTHKVYLMDFPYFKNKIESQSYFKDEELDQINISKFDYEIVYGMIKYMYTLKVDITMENVQDLFKIADEVWKFEIWKMELSINFINFLF